MIATAFNIKSLPKKRQTFTRDQWTEFQNAHSYECFTYDNHSVLLSLNYKCDGPYSENQKIIYLGVIITVYHPKTTLQQESFTMQPGFTEQELMNKIDKMIAAVDKLCTHPKSRRTSKGSMCDNEWYCPDCNKTFQLDSSD